MTDHEALASIQERINFEVAARLKDKDALAWSTQYELLGIVIPLVHSSFGPNWNVKLGTYKDGVQQMVVVPPLERVDLVLEGT